MVDRVDPAQLAAVELFSELTEEDLEQIAGMMQVSRVPIGTVLAVEGDLPTKFFVLLGGNVTVHRAGRHLADLGAGDVFGEAGAVVLQARNATVIATTPAEIAVMMGWDLRGIIARYPSVKARIDALVGARSADG